MMFLSLADSFKVKKVFLVCLSLSLLFACQSNIKEAEAESEAALGRLGRIPPDTDAYHEVNYAGKYTIRNVEYKILADADNFIEIGQASWYGPGFHGRRTANGERYDMNALTAAHKSLPFNTKLKVTNLKNKRTVVVRVNDRGPFHDNRVIDLSRAAAKKIGIMRAGVGSVKIEVIE